MAKAEIIDSYSLGCLMNSLYSEIEKYDNQINVYEAELKQEKQHRQDEKTIDRIRNSREICIVRRDVLHQCLCKIQSYSKEIEI